MSLRRVADDILTEQQCLELISIHKGLAVLGYRPGVRSTTIHDVALACPELLVPLVRARQLVWQSVEDMFGLECELHVEFTGLISWTAGSSLGWHADNNREYLSQRHFSSVLYLNSPQELAEENKTQCGRSCMQHAAAALPGFTGGNLRFQNGPGPCCVVPKGGRLVAYAADDSNIHMVEEVQSGERYTLTMWFTRLAAHREDDKVLRLLLRHGPGGQPCSLPSAMYCHDGEDLRLKRLAGLGCRVRQASGIMLEYSAAGVSKSNVKAAAMHAVCGPATGGSADGTSDAGRSGLRDTTAGAAEERQASCSTAGTAFASCLCGGWPKKQQPAVAGRLRHEAEACSEDLLHNCQPEQQQQQQQQQQLKRSQQDEPSGTLAVKQQRRLHTSCLSGTMQHDCIDMVGSGHVTTACHIHRPEVHRDYPAGSSTDQEGSVCVMQATGGGAACAAAVPFVNSGSERTGVAAAQATTSCGELAAAHACMAAAMAASPLEHGEAQCTTPGLDVDAPVVVTVQQPWCCAQASKSIENPVEMICCTPATAATVVTAATTAPCALSTSRTHTSQPLNTAAARGELQEPSCDEVGRPGTCVAACKMPQQPCAAPDELQAREADHAMRIGASNRHPVQCSVAFLFPNVSMASVVMHVGQFLLACSSTEGGSLLSVGMGCNHPSLMAYQRDDEGQVCGHATTVATQHQTCKGCLLLELVGVYLSGRSKDLDLMLKVSHRAGLLLLED